MALIFHKLVSVLEARRKTEEAIAPVDEHEDIPVTEALGRVLSEDVYSDMDSPPFDRSEVDGYAVYSGDVEEADQDSPVKLNIQGKSLIGEQPEKLDSPGSCIKIATGAVLPVGCDSVVMVEYTRERGGTVEIFRSVKPGESISRSGVDLSRGDIVLRKNSSIGPREIAVLSSIGIKRIQVLRKLRIAIVSTGNELVEPGESIAAGRIFESNGITIKALLEQYGNFQAHYHGIIRDDRNAIKGKITELLNNYDAVITSGSTSAGEGDMVYDILREFNPGILFHGVDIKPGKPTLLAVHDKKPVIGLPGFPVSAVMVFETIFLPALLKAAGIRHSHKTLEAVLPVRVNLNMGKLNLIPVSLVRRSGFSAYPMLGDSGSVSRLMNSDGYISAYGDRQYLEEGENFDITLFAESYSIPELTFIGSHDIALEAIFSKLSMDVKVINVGSMGGIKAIRRSEADIAGVHLLNPDTLKYNDFTDDQELMDKAVLVKGYRREQGFVVPRGNPDMIHDISDIRDRKVRFVNRNPGSGTRVLVDKMLRDNGIEPTEIVNFSYDVRTHNAVANAIWSGRADAGVAIRQAAVMYGLDFVPIGPEEYDFLVLKESKDRMSGFVEALKSSWFRRKLEKDFSGYLP